MIAPSKMPIMIEAFDILSDLVVVHHLEADEADDEYYEPEAKESMETLLRAIDPYAELCIDYMRKHPDKFTMRDGQRIDMVVNAYKYAGLLTGEESQREQ